MGNLERPLTWGLAIVIMGYLFIANCECGEGKICPLNFAFDISSSGINANALEVDVPETVEEDGEMVDSVSIEYMEMLQGSNDSLDMMEQAEEIEEE